MEFRVSSALKDLIGKELITDDQTAIFELVKNSYDADASKVRVIFKSINGTNPRILVVDDGIGMNREDIENKWLFVGFSEKREEYIRAHKERKKTSRIYAGSKGIGRFSCDRLGKLLTIFSKTESDEGINELIVFWDRFEVDQSEEFQNIEIDFNIVHSIIYPTVSDFFKTNTHGTVLQIEELNSSWEDPQKLVRLKRYLQRLINPEQFKNDNFQINIEAEDFLDHDQRNIDKQKDDQIINGEVQNFVFKKIEPNTTTIDVNITVNEISTKLFDKGELIFQLETSVPEHLANLYGIHASISFLNKYAKSVFKRMMGIDSVDFGHIYLYKNGFRIHPYGDPSDDWLGIGRRQQQGHYRYIGNRDLVGRVEILGDQVELREVTSRSSGLVMTEMAYQLIDFIKNHCIRILERYIIDALNWERISDETEKNVRILELVEKIYGSEVKKQDRVVYVNPRLKILLEKKQIEKIPSLMSQIGNQIKHEKVDISEIREAIASLNKSIDFQKKEYERKIQIANQEVALSRAITATDYSQILEYIHTIAIQSENITEYINKLFSQELPNNLKTILQYVKIENDKISSISNFLTKPDLLVKSTRSLKDIVDFYCSYLVDYPNLDEDRLRFKYEFIPEKLEFPVKFKPLEATTIIDNIISNSRKHEATELLFRFNKISPETLIISFIDNGSGIDDDIPNLESLFNKGVTTTAGSGIGLFSVAKSAKRISKRSKISVDALYDKGFKIDWELIL